jgi:hypothetical protein
MNIGDADNKAGRAGFALGAPAKPRGLDGLPDGGYASGGTLNTGTPADAALDRKAPPPASGAGVRTTGPRVNPNPFGVWLMRPAK